MIAIGRYFVLVLYVTGTPTTLPEDRFSAAEQANFLQILFDLHNEKRELHGLKPLSLDVTISQLAGETLKGVSIGTITDYPKNYGKNFAFQPYDDATKLDDDAAKAMFSTWYDTDNSTEILSESAEQLGLGIIVNPDINHYAVLALYYSPKNQEEN